MPFEFNCLQIPEVILIQPTVFPDQRGFFKEIYRRSDFALNHIPQNFVQDNVSLSHRNVVRGLHYQRDPKSMGKLVSVYLGEIWDVAVDIRLGSPSYGKWVSAVLSDKNHRMVYVPQGFAHGFCCLSEEAVVAYKVTNEFDPELDAGFRWNDPDVGIQWPVADPVLSGKDQALPRLADSRADFTYLKNASP